MSTCIMFSPILFGLLVPTWMGLLINLFRVTAYVVGPMDAPEYGGLTTSAFHALMASTYGILRWMGTDSTELLTAYTSLAVAYFVFDLYVVHRYDFVKPAEKVAYTVHHLVALTLSYLYISRQSCHLFATMLLLTEIPVLPLNLYHYMRLSARFPISPSGRVESGRCSKISRLVAIGMTFVLYIVCRLLGLLYALYGEQSDVMCELAFHTTVTHPWVTRVTYLLILAIQFVFTAAIGRSVLKAYRACRSVKKSE